MSDLDKITAREKEIAKLISDLQQEAGDLAIARRVLIRLEPGQHQINLTATSLTVGDGKLGPKRPDGAPSTFAMAEGALSDAEVAGKDGLTGKELVDAIRENIGPVFNPDKSYQSSTGL